MFDINKPFTFDGMPARIVSRDLKGSHPIGVAVDMGDHEVMVRMNELGDSPYMKNKVVNIPVEKILWLNVYKDGRVFTHTDKDNALRGSGNNNQDRLTARLKIVVKEGQFDD